MQIIYTEEDRREEERLFKEFDPAVHLAHMRRRDVLPSKEWDELIEIVRQRVREEIHLARFLGALWEFLTSGDGPASACGDEKHHLEELGLREAFWQHANECGNGSDAWTGWFDRNGTQGGHDVISEWEDSEHDLMNRAAATAAGHGLFQRWLVKEGEGR